MIQASGLILKAGDRVLLLKRSDNGQWAFPGGHIEPGETAEQAAVRETLEETGLNSNELTPGQPVLLTRSEYDAVDFTTFIQPIAEEVPVELNDEHTAWGWFSLGKLPSPMLPGAQLALDRIKMDELEIAQAMASGLLASPQYVGRMALFAIRVTGTGVAYRVGLDEFTFRHPRLYLNEHFLGRCNGLPVVMEHPESAVLDSDEFQDRVVGTILLPYIRGDEVWGIARIYDSATIKMLGDNMLSTSPGVVFTDPDENSTTKLEDGSVLLIEGKPGILDHLALCEQGVWDKSNAPEGVEASNITTGDTIMPEEAKLASLEENTYDDAAEGSHLEKALGYLDAISKRMDAMEAEFGRKDEAKFGRKDEAKFGRKDEAEQPAEPELPKADAEGGDPNMGDMPQETAADKARKDAEKKMEEERARTDAEIRRRIADVEERIKPMSDEERGKYADVQARADSVYSAFGQQASHPMAGEGLQAYRRRLAIGLKRHSPEWAPVDLARLDSATLAIAETQIYNHAAVAARNPAGLPEGQMRTIVTSDDTGRKIKNFVGRPRDWMQSFGCRQRRVVNFNRQQAGSR